MSRRLLLALVLLGALGLVTVGAQASSLPRLTECQKPVRTGEEAFNLEHVSAAVACPVVLALGKWEYQSVAHIKALYRCAGISKSSPGHPVLNRHAFEGWALSINARGDFEMTRGKSSFDVTGTDFPLNCT